MQLFKLFYVRGIVGVSQLEPFLLYILFRRSTLVVQLLQYVRLYNYSRSYISLIIIVRLIRIVWIRRKSV
jgi:hypothetical protein